MSRSDRSGFTLYETLLVLVLSTGLAVMLAQPAHQVRPAASERYFWSAYQGYWRSARQTAIDRQTIIGLRINDQQHQLELWLPQPQNRLLSTLPIPRSLVLERRHSTALFTFHPDGWTDAHRVYWYSTQNQRWWVQIVQIGGNVFDVWPQNHPAWDH